MPALTNCGDRGLQEGFAFERCFVLLGLCLLKIFL